MCIENKIFVEKEKEMPNIEMHGIKNTETSHQLRKKIFTIFANQPYVDEMVVTVVDSWVQDKNAKSQPFLRLVNSCQKHTAEILAGLRLLEMDIEHLQLEAFYPKEHKETCSDCGSVVTRNGTCVKCLNCGHTTGCS